MRTAIRLPLIPADDGYVVAILNNGVTLPALGRPAHRGGSDRLTDLAVVAVRGSGRAGHGDGRG
jgi:hypothetical protein